jgi:hypothetical protein
MIVKREIEPQEVRGVESRPAGKSPASEQTELSPLNARRTNEGAVRDAIEAETVLFEEGIPMPESLWLESEPGSSGWTSFKNLDRYELARKINNAGWTFFYMADEIKATVFGFDRRKMARTALKRIITKVRSQKCNSLEITQVTSGSFLKVPYVTVSAHARHIQEGLVFSGQ